MISMKMIDFPSEIADFVEDNWFSYVSSKTFAFEIKIINSKKVVPNHKINGNLAKNLINAEPENAEPDKYFKRGVYSN